MPLPFRLVWFFALTLCVSSSQARSMPTVSCCSFVYAVVCGARRVHDRVCGESSRGSKVKANVSSENNEKSKGKGSGGIGQQDELIGHFATLCISIDRRIRTLGRLSYPYLCHQRRVHEDRCCFAARDIAGRRKLMKDKHMMYLSLPQRRSRL